MVVAQAVLGSVGMTEEKEEFGGRTTSSYTASLLTFRAASAKCKISFTNIASPITHHLLTTQTCCLSGLVPTTLFIYH